MVALTLLCTILCISKTIAQEQPKQYQSYIDYIQQYKSIAITEMERTGIPASIKLAQGLLESNAGKSTLAREANNHFGIKCGNDWSGSTYHIEDDDFDGEGNKIQSCFRKYDNPISSHIDHSEFIRDPRKVKRYGFLFTLDRTDYRAWAQGLKTAGYATSEQYPQLLIKIIENYKLAQYDSMSDVDVIVSTQTASIRKIIFNNDVKMVVAKAGDTPISLASLFDAKAKQIIKYNEEITSINQSLKEGERVYLQKKRSSYRGKQKYHYVQQGERMYDISQLYGVRLSKLYAKNKMKYGDEPKVGQKIKLSGLFNIKLPTSTTSSEGSKPPTNIGQDPEHLDMIPDNGKFDFEIPSKIPPEVYYPPVKDEPKVNDQKNPSTSNPKPDDTTKPNDPSSAIYHTVEPGETLYRISRKYNVLIDDIKRLNQLDSDIISVGMQLRVK
ncbi:MAG: LysM peptidoglycan-binding domain-containing protein [Saprospiraceae bacterium]|nr:LysM peptidoglycan-binding domain-containing protein [Saprospiraceae bacterium]